MIKYIQKPSEMALINLVLDLVDNADDFFLGGDNLDASEVLEGKLMFLHLMLMILAGDLAEGLGDAPPSDEESMSKPMTYLLSAIATMTEEYVKKKGTSKEDKITFREGQALPSGNFFYNLFELNFYK